MMDLRSIKKEVESLPNIQHNVKDIFLQVIKPLHVSESIFKNLSHQGRAELKKKLSFLKKSLEDLNNGQNINERLLQQSRMLIELKLTTINGDKQKFNAIKKNLLQDKVFNFHQNISHVQDFQTRVKEVHQQYQEIDQLLSSSLNLENSVIYSDLPHHILFQRLYNTSQKQKELVHHLGKELVQLVKKD